MLFPVSKIKCEHMASVLHVHVVSEDCLTFTIYTYVEDIFGEINEGMS